MEDKLEKLEKILGENFVVVYRQGSRCKLIAKKAFDYPILGFIAQFIVNFINIADGIARRNDNEQ